MATNNAINQIGVLPAFMYTNNADQTNVTGDATAYNVQFNTKIFDRTNSFDGVSTFTAPLTGTYFFNISLNFNGIDAAMAVGLVYLTTTSNTYRFVQGNFYPIAQGGTFAISNYSTICSMAVGDTAVLAISFLGSTKTLTINSFTTGTAGYLSPIFSGYMIAGI